MDFEYKDQLLKAAYAGDLVLFLGAGVVAGSKVGKDQRQAFLGSQLAQALAGLFFPDEPYRNESLKRICTEVENIEGKSKLVRGLSDLLLPVTPSDALKIIPTIQWKSIYTVNVDNSLEQSYDAVEEQVQGLVPVIQPHDRIAENLFFEVSYFKLHGCLSVDPDNVIFSQKDYTESREKYLKLFAALKSSLCDKPFLFIGFGFEDDDFEEVWQNIKKYTALERRSPPTFVVLPNPTERFIKSMKIEGITVVNSLGEDFLPWLKVSMPGKHHPVKEKIVEGTKATRRLIEMEYSTAVPPEIISKVQEFSDIVSHIPSPTKTLSQSQFLLGRSPDWDDIKLGLPIRRDLEEDVLVDIDNWLGAKGVKASLVLGPAGYGKTTLLMNLANTFASSTLTIWIKDPAKFEAVLLLDILKTLNRPAIVFIDECYRCISALRKFITDSRDNKVDVFILAASRPSDWNNAKQTSSLEKLNTIDLKKLTEREAIDLAETMKRSGKLNEDFASKSTMELANHYMEEGERHIIAGLMTSAFGFGAKFDEIIADEYFKIQSDSAKETYILTSIVHSLGQSLPFSLYIRALGIDFSSYQGISPEIEGTVVEEQDVKGELYLKSQHRVIAETLVTKVLGPSHANTMLLRLARNVNQHSREENNILKEIYNEDFLETILAEPGYIRAFFEQISEEFPSDIFILQHWAIYESKHDNHEPAKLLIEKAISKLESDSKFYYHFLNCKGIIWLREALSEKDSAKAEYLFKKGSDFIREQIKLDPDKEIHYISLIDKLLAFSKRSNLNQEDKLHLYEEIENDLEKALDRYPNSSEILTLSGRLASDLSNFPGAKESLQKSLNINKGNIKARILLARLFFRDDEYKEALVLIEDGLIYSPASSTLRKMKINCYSALNKTWGENKGALKDYLKLVPADIEKRMILVKGLIENGEISELQKELTALKKIDLPFNIKRSIETEVTQNGKVFVACGEYQSTRFGKGFVHLDGFPVGINAFINIFQANPKNKISNGCRLKFIVGLNGFGLFVKQLLG